MYIEWVSVRCFTFSFQSSHTVQYLSPVQVDIIQLPFFPCPVYMYIKAILYRSLLYMYMRCIFPCLQLIYFSMVVKILLSVLFIASGSRGC